MSTNKTEMTPGSQLLQALNYYAGLEYYGTSGFQNASASPITIPTQSIDSYLKDIVYPWTDAWGRVYQCDPPGGNVQTYYCDDLISANHQAIRLNIEPSHLPPAFVTDTGNPFNSSDIGSNPDCYIAGIHRMLHFNRCLGDQANTRSTIYGFLTPILAGQTTNLSVQVKLDGNAWTGAVSYSLYGPNGDVRPETSAVSLPGVESGSWAIGNVVGPRTTYTVTPSNAQIIGWNPVTQTNNWTTTFSINFVSNPPAPPVVATSAASGIAGDGATLNGTVNPEGSATTAWFDYSTSSTLATFQSTTPQTVAAGTTSQPFSYNLAGFSSNTTYYFRAAASNAAGTVRSTTILSFTTLSTLAPPTLLAPSNGATGVATSQTFNWSAVTNATSYRLIVATNAAALPTDPTSGACGAGCVLNVTPAGTSYTPDANALSPGAVYTWEVHARSPLQYGAWSSIFNFTTVAVAGNDFSLLVNPSAQSVSQTGSVGYNVTSTTTSGSPQSVTFSVYNLPSGITGSFTPTTVTSGSSLESDD